MTDLAFGLRADLREGYPEGAAIWGARWIWPNDLIWDRQDTFPHAPAAQDGVLALHNWLNAGALACARARAAALALTDLAPSDVRTVTLYEDDRGVVQANPQGSCGYLYVAAWLKQ